MNNYPVFESWVKAFEKDGSAWDKERVIVKRIDTDAAQLIYPSVQKVDCAWKNLYGGTLSTTMVWYRDTGVAGERVIVDS